MKQLRMMLTGCFVLGLFGLAGTVGGCLEHKVSSRSKTEPQSITCQQLGESGPGDNLHIELTDFQLDTDNYVIEQKGRITKRWEKAFIPIMPAGQDEDELPDAFSVLLITEMAKSEQAVDELALGETITGMVINDITSLDSETEELLKEAYPEVDVDALWIVEHQRKPTAPAVAIAMSVLGVASLLASAALGIFGVVKFVESTRGEPGVSQSPGWQPQTSPHQVVGPTRPAPPVAQQPQPPPFSQQTPPDAQVYEAYVPAEVVTPEVVPTHTANMAVGAGMARQMPQRQHTMTSSWAIVSLVLSLVSMPLFCFLLPSIAAVIFGHIGLSEINRSRGRITGKGMAIAGLVIGYLMLAAGVGIFALAILGGD